VSHLVQPEVEGLEAGVVGGVVVVVINELVLIQPNAKKK
jgi:hypothetical protein